MEEGKTESPGAKKSTDRIERFDQLRVYQEAFKLAMEIFQLSKQWPREELYSLIDQIRRSSRSICGSIAEAWHKRRYVPHFVSKLSDADMELGETKNWLQFAAGCGYLSQNDYRNLNRGYDRISGGLVRMMVEPDKWCGPANLVREDTVSYEVSP